MQQGSLARIRRRRGPNVWAYRWREPGATGKIIYRNRVIGTVEEFPNKAAVLTAIAGLKRQINSRDPRMQDSTITLEELVHHYRQRELTPENTWKSYSTKRGYEGYLKKWIVPRWGAYSLAAITSVEVEL